MTIDPFRIPTDQEIAEAEQKLNFRFPFAYIEFLKSGSNVANSAFEPAVILPGCRCLDIFEIAATTWSMTGCQKNGFHLLKTMAITSAFHKLAKYGIGRTMVSKTKNGQISQHGFNKFV